MKKFLTNYLDLLTKSLLNINIKKLEFATKEISTVIKKNKVIYICGNGGSAAIANHYVCDYLKYLRQHTNLKPRIVSLSNNLETITAISNDLHYKKIFSYQAESLFNKGDLLILISSSGNSDNIKEVLKLAKKRKLKSIGFSGFDGGFLKKNCDISIHIDAKNYGISEDSHHILMHIILQYLIKKYKKL